MRFAIIKAIYEEALKNKKLYFLSGDLGHIYVDEFKTNLANQYKNTGIAEQNLIGIAAGLALSGMKPIVYSIVPFITMRCFEQIKNDVCYQNVDVTLVGIGGGFDYGKYANTHCSIEDIAVMRVLPNMKVVCPANPYEVVELMKQLTATSGPTYIRIGRGREPMPSSEYPVIFGKGSVVRDGKDITILTTGTILPEAEKAAEILEKTGVSTEIVSIHTVKPLDTELINDRLQKRKGLFTMEEHNIIGGLGGAVAEIIGESNSTIKFKRFGAQDQYLKEIGSSEYLRKRHGLDAQHVAETIQKILK